MKKGGWSLAELQEVSLPEDVATAFKAATAIWEGADFTPVLYAGQQVVKGINYMLFCKSKSVTPEPTEGLVKVVINSFQNECSIVSIETII